jgi:Na+/H+ antiporter NhaD/arsenite permease-like protein
MMMLVMMFVVVLVRAALMFVFVVMMMMVFVCHTSYFFKFLAAKVHQHFRNSVAKRDSASYFTTTTFLFWM